MPDEFPYDVFLSHSAKDKAVVRPLAERLRQDGLKVWFDEWVLKPGDSIPAKIEEGLENSRVLVLCMSANAFGSDWAQLESGPFRFRDPLNLERRFIPLRLDNAPIKGSLAQFLYINWRPADREQEYARLLQACEKPELWPLSQEAKEHGADNKKVGDSSALQANPFHPAGALRPDDPTYIRRQSDTEFENMLVGPDRLISITGDFCVGKTSLMLQARRLLPNHLFFGGYLADCRSDDPQRFMKNFFKLFAGEFGAIDEWDDLERQANQRPSILLLDDIGEILAAGLEALIPPLIARFRNPGPGLRVITTSPVSLSAMFAHRGLRDPKFIKPWKCIHVSPFRDTELQELLRLLSPRSRELALKSMSVIKEKSQSIPLRVQGLCRLLFESEVSKASDQDLLAIIHDEKSYA